jgi:hypothetical protein
VCLLDEEAGTEKRLADTGSTAPLWAYLQKQWPQQHAEIDDEKQGPRGSEKAKAAEAAGGEVYAFNSPKATRANLLLLDVIQSRTLPLNLGEDAKLRAFVNALDARVQLAGHETMSRFNVAKHEAINKKKLLHIKELTAAGYKVSVQVDMWSKDAKSFMSINYTWTEFGEEDIAMPGAPPKLRRALVVKTDVLDFVEFNTEHTAVNVAELINEVLEKYGLTFNAVAIIVLDGASNCTAAMNILREQSYSTEGHAMTTCVCMCHQFGRLDVTASGARNPELQRIIKKVIRVSLKFRRTPSLRKGLTVEQLDGGVVTPLQLCKGAETRWNGKYFTLLRYRLLRIFLRSALLNCGTVHMPAEDDDGNEIEGAPAVAVVANTLLPTEHEDKVAREYEALAKPLQEATDDLQGLNCTPERAWEITKNLYDKYKEWTNDDATIPVPMTYSSKGKHGPHAVAHVKVSSLTNESREYIRLAVLECEKRFIGPGPTHNQLMCIKLNRTFPQSSCLTEAQIASMNMNFRSAAERTAEAIERARAISVDVDSSSSASSSSSSSSSTSSSSPSSTASDTGTAPATLVVDLGVRAMRPIFLPDEAAVAVDARAPWELEIEAFEQLRKKDLVFTLRGDELKFFVRVFWADRAIIAKFPILSALARGEFSGVAAEATSERTFSYSGRAFSNLRRNMSPANLSAMVAGAACPWPITDTEVMAEYETRREQRERREAAARAAAEANAAAVAAGASDSDSD